MLDETDAFEKSSSKYKYKQTFHFTLKIYYIKCGDEEKARTCRKMRYRDMSLFKSKFSPDSEFGLFVVNYSTTIYLSNVKRVLSKTVFKYI